MRDEQDIACVRGFLTKAGLSATAIPVATSMGCRRCDLRAEDARERYLIEVKGFNDDATINETLRRGEVHERAHLHAYRDTVAKGVRDAIKQLKGTATEYDDHLWLVALLAKSKYDAFFLSEQIIGTLYGVGAITDCGSVGGNRRRRCLYFSESAFYKHPDLDGAIVLGPDGVSLCMNDYGRRLDRVRQSGLARFLAQHNACYDMAKWESDGDCLVADFEMDRADEPAVLAHLKQKYPDLQLEQMTWHRWEGIGTFNLSSNPND